MAARSPWRVTAERENGQAGFSEQEFLSVNATWKKLRKSFSEMEISETVAYIYIYIFVHMYKNIKIFLSNR